ncbi:hypothetical protein F7725_018072 [Dissostichus mawsoni]|uniref:Peptidase S1 domain-containing protein n=1 Tax=Dissostichus mawsoni TaxID=36200 RepID=A0A7J5XQG4_DISMA|nr:hypothetical protein F7725_018072 [Dissostichus mawsoni]
MAHKVPQTHSGQQRRFIYPRVHFGSGSDKSTPTSNTMNKLLVITVLVALLAPSFRVKRQAEDTEGVVEEEVVPEVVAEVEVEVVPEVVEEQGSLAKFTDTVKTYYSDAVNTARASPLEDFKVCQPHSRPWQVYLHGGGVSCSGALIDPWWIHDVTVEEGTEQHIYVADVIRHSPYRSPLHSLTMVRLAEPALLTQDVQPVPLSVRCPRPGETCQVSGWGSTVPNQCEWIYRSDSGFYTSLTSH